MTSFAPIFDASGLNQTATAALQEVVDVLRQTWRWLMIACGMHQPDDLLEIGRRDEVRFQAEGYWQEMLPHVTKALEEQAEKARAAGLKAATACTPGDPAEVMMNVAKDVGARLIVVGSTGAGLVAEMVGSTTLRLLRKSKLPVLVVPKG